MTARILFSLAFALVFSAIYAFAVTRFGHRVHDWLRARYERHLDARISRGQDRYFEEKRSIESSAPAPYIAHGFGWHFVRAFAIVAFITAFNILNDFLFSE